MTEHFSAVFTEQPQYGVKLCARKADVFVAVFLLGTIFKGVERKKADLLACSTFLSSVRADRLNTVGLSGNVNVRNTEGVSMIRVVLKKAFLYAFLFSLPHWNVI